MSRRGENIFKRKDGRWEARYIHHYENGKAKYRYLYGKSYGEVRQKRLSEQQKGREMDTRRHKNSIDFETLAGRWLASVKAQVKESTYTRYDRIVYVYLKPAFQKSYFWNHLEDLPEYLLQSGGVRGGALSPKTVTDILCVWKSVLKYGRQNGLLYLNEAAIKYPQKSAKRACAMDETSRKRLENIILSSETVESLGILLALFAGLRIGELCGLKWADIDFANQTLCVSRTVERIADLDAETERKTKIIVGTPKTGSSERVIPLPHFLTERLSQFSQFPDAYVLTGTSKPMEPHCFYIRYRKFLQKNGFSEMTFHALRHTFATRCVELGFDAKALSEVLGHSSVTTTLAVYVHPTLQQKRAQMERLVPEWYL